MQQNSIEERAEVSAVFRLPMFQPFDPRVVGIAFIISPRQIFRSSNKTNNHCTIFQIQRLGTLDSKGFSAPIMGQTRPSPLMFNN